MNNISTVVAPDAWCVHAGKRNDPSACLASAWGRASLRAYSSYYAEIKPLFTIAAKRTPSLSIPRGSVHACTIETLAAPDPWCVRARLHTTRVRVSPALGAEQPRTHTPHIVSACMYNRSLPSKDLSTAGQMSIVHLRNSTHAGRDSWCMHVWRVRSQRGSCQRLEPGSLARVHHTLY